jgi:hypothetical protein
MILGSINTIRPVFVNYNKGTLKSGTSVLVTDVNLSATSLSGVTLNVLVHIENEDYYQLHLDFFHVMKDRNSLALLIRAIRRGEGKKFLKSLIVTKKYGL